MCHHFVVAMLPQETQVQSFVNSIDPQSKQRMKQRMGYHHAAYIHWFPFILTQMEKNGLPCASPLFYDKEAPKCPCKREKGIALQHLHADSL